MRVVGERCWGLPLVWEGARFQPSPSSTSVFCPHTALGSRGRIWAMRGKKCKVKVAQSCRTLRPIDYSPWNSPGQNTGVGSLSLLQVIFPTQGSNPGLPHCRRILYQLSFKGSPYSENLMPPRLAQMHLVVSLNVFLKPYTRTAKGLCVVCVWLLGSLSRGSLLRCISFFCISVVEFLWVLLVLKCLWENGSSHRIIFLGRWN